MSKRSRHYDPVHVAIAAPTSTIDLFPEEAAEAPAGKCEPVIDLLKIVDPEHWQNVTCSPRVKMLSSNWSKMAAVEKHLDKCDAKRFESPT